MLAGPQLKEELAQVQARATASDWWPQKYKDQPLFQGRTFLAPQISCGAGQAGLGLFGSIASPSTHSCFLSLPSVGVDPKTPPSSHLPAKPSTLPWGREPTGSFNHQRSSTGGAAQPASGTRGHSTHPELTAHWPATSLRALPPEKPDFILFLPQGRVPGRAPIGQVWVWPSSRPWRTQYLFLVVHLNHLFEGRSSQSQINKRQESPTEQTDPRSLDIMVV